LSTNKDKQPFDPVIDPVLILDRGGRLLRANRAFYKATGLDPQSAVGLPLTEFAHPEGKSQLCEVCADYLKAVPDPGDATNTSSSSNQIDIRFHGIYTAHGERLGTMQIIRDLTVLSHSGEDEIAHLRRSLSRAYDAVYAASPEGELIWTNDRASELLGFASESIQEEFCLKSIHPEDSSRIRAAFELAAGGEAQRSEVRLLMTDGETRRILVTNSPMYAEGRVVAVLGIMRDITEEREAAEQAMRSDKLRALGQLAWGVAHNFNNSLTAVLGYTQLVLNKISDPTIQRNLKTVEKAALDAAKMVQRIQNFARQGKDDAAAPADLNQIIRDALDLTRSRWRDDARAAGIVYDVIFRPEEGVIALCDQSAMREVFVSIIINAIEAMPSGGRLTITTTVDGEDLVANFVDTGLGMTGETRQRIFEPFYTTKGAKGQGMGLAVTYGIVERHGGEIQVTSEPGHGSTFTISLKRAPEPQAAPIYADGHPTVRSSSVLVVDDEAPIRVLLSDLLRARGHKVMTAEDGLAGLRAVEHMRFDMVITDLSMPGADGWSIIEETRRRSPETKVVILTGYGGFAELAVPGGDTSVVDALISKPFNIAEIDLTINRLLVRDEYPV
jgi:PAS domain S-box-containing protein